MLPPWPSIREHIGVPEGQEQVLEQDVLHPGAILASGTNGLPESPWQSTLLSQDKEPQEFASAA